jgi:hypothetical protein
MGFLKDKRSVHNDEMPTEKSNMNLSWVRFSIGKTHKANHVRSYNVTIVNDFAKLGCSKQ